MQRPVWAQQIAKARRDAGYTQVGLAEALKIGQSTVASWERGQNEPSIDMFMRLAGVLKVGPAMLAFSAEDVEGRVKQDFGELIDQVIEDDGGDKRKLENAVVKASVVLAVHSCFQERGFEDILSTLPTTPLYRWKLQQLFLTLVSRTARKIEAADTEEGKVAAMAEALQHVRNNLDQLKGDLEGIIERAQR